MIKIDLITGFLGSGKTTFIKKYASYLLKKGMNIGILENDFGAVNVDMMLLQDLMGDNCELEMVSGGCDADCHRRRFKTKLIAMGMCGYDRVIVEPSGIFDVDEFFDALDKWYEIGNVIAIVDAKLSEDLSAEADYLLASEVADAGCVLLSRSQEATVEEISSTKEHLNRALGQIQCRRCLDSEIPVVYTAVSDPVGAGLADEEGNSVGNITGTSDKLPVEEQLKMIRDLMPDAKKIGILYTTSEANSVSTIKEYKELAENYDFEIVDSGINTVADVEMAAKDLASKVDCISNLTDNTVVSALQTVIAAADEKNIPVFGSEIEQVKSGCLASMGIDYIALGKQTGEMAAKILKGESKAEEMPYEVCSGASLYVNTAVADKLNFELDQATVDGAAEVFDEITVE